MQERGCRLCAWGAKSKKKKKELGLVQKGPKPGRFVGSWSGSRVAYIGYETLFLSFFHFPSLSSLFPSLKLSPLSSSTGHLPR